MTCMKRCLIFMGLICSLFFFGQAHAEDSQLISEASNEALILSLVHKKTPWKSYEVTTELQNRAKQSNNSLSVDKITADTLARAFVESATPDIAHRGDRGMLRPNQCRSTYESCGRAMELIARSNSLEPHQEKSISAAALGLWEDSRSSQRYQSGSNRSSTVSAFLKVLNTANEIQPLTSLSISNLVEMVVEHPGTGGTEDIKLIRDILKNSLARDQLTNQQKLDLLEGLALSKKGYPVSLFASFYLDDINRYADAAREKRLRFWFYHDNNSIRRGLLKSFRTLSGDAEARKVLLDEARKPNPANNICAALRSVTSKSVLTDSELMEFVNLMAITGYGCSHEAISVTSQEVARRKTVDEKIPNSVVEKLSTLVIEYSGDLSSNQMDLVKSIIRVLNELETDALLSAESLNNITTWFAAFGKGGKIVDSAFKTGQLDETRLLDILELAFEYSAYSKFVSRDTNIANIYIDNRFSDPFYDLLAGRTRNVDGTGKNALLLEILVGANKQQILNKSPVAAALLLSHAEELKYSISLTPLLALYATNEVLADLAKSVAHSKVDLQLRGLDLLTSVELPDDIVKLIAPLLMSQNQGAAQFTAEYFRDHFGKGPNGRDWLINTSFDSNQAMILRDTSILALSDPMLEGSHLRTGEEVSLEVRQALIEHVESGPSKLRLRALRGLRKPFELEREWLLSLTNDEDNAIALEAWRQMESKFGEKISLRDKWRLNPRSFSNDASDIAALIVVIMGFLSIGLGTFTAIIVPIMSLMAGTKKAVLTAIVVFLTASVSAVAIYALGFMTIIVFGMSHGSGARAIPWLTSAVWFVALLSYWVALYFVARYGYRLSRNSAGQSA